jgi:PhnB protein
MYVSRMTSLELHLVVDDPDAAAAWYARALGAEETGRVTLPGGVTLTVDLRFADIKIAVAGEFPGARLRTPASAGVSTAAFHLRVPDADAAWQRAVDAGATVFEPLHDAFWGDRTGQFLDPSGHRWAIDQHLRDVPPAELAEHLAAMFA